MYSSVCFFFFFSCGACQLLVGHLQTSSPVVKFMPKLCTVPPMSLQLSPTHSCPPSWPIYGHEQTTESVCRCNIRKSFIPVFVWFISHILPKAAASSECYEMFINGHIFTDHVILLQCSINTFQKGWKLANLSNLKNGIICWKLSILNAALEICLPLQVLDHSDLRLMLCKIYTK